MNDLLAALLLGIIEGITEFLPISSTGHLLIAERWLGHRSDLFNISIQAGAILAVVLIYWQRLVSLTVGFREPRKRDYALKLALAFGVTAVLGVVVKKLGFQLPESIEPVAWALLLGGFVILGVEAIDARRPDLPDDDPDAIGWGTAILVGLAQVLAGVFPGTSRSAAAIFAALLFGKSSRLAATEFAFLVGIPTMFAATGYELIRMLRDGSAANEDWTALAVAFVASAITAFVAVKWLLRYIQTHRFTIFAWYRIAFGAALLAWLYFGATAPAAVPAAQATPPARVAVVQADHAPADATAIDATTDDAPAPEEAAAIASTAVAAPTEDPATVALMREYALLDFCREARHARHVWLADSMQPVVEGNLAAQVPHRAQNQAFWKRKLDEMDRDQRRCAGTEHKLLDGSSYDLALRAAELGNSQAAQCFVAARFPMPPKMRQDRRVLDQWRLDAARLIEQGIERGDWNLVFAASHAYAPRSELATPKFAAPEYVPDHALLESIGGPEGDLRTSYRIMRLRTLGAGTPEDAANARRWAAEYAQRLAAPQVLAADEWARRAFEQQFHGRAMREENAGLCASP